MKIAVLGSLQASLVGFRGPLLRELVRAGHNVTGFAPDNDPAIVAELENLGAKFESVSLQRNGLNPLTDSRFYRDLCRIFRRTRPDVLFAYTVKPVVYGLLAAAAVGVPHRVAMITGLGHAFVDESLIGRTIGVVVRLLYRLALRQATAVIFHNDDDYRMFSRLGLVTKRTPVAVVHGSGVDTEHFSPSPVPDGPFTFVLVARLLREKGISEYVTAAARVRKDYPQTRFLLVGPLDTNPSAVSAQELENWQRQGNITFVGATTDVRPYIYESHVLVLPSYREGMPRTVLEAMACGRAVITTDVAGCRSAVIDGETGLIVPVRDSSALADAMIKLINAPQLVNEMGLAGRVRADTVYRADRVAHETIRAMRLDEKSVPTSNFLTT